MPKYKNHPKFDGIYYRRKPRQYFTVNYDEGRSIYGEKLKDYGDIELRRWDPYRSKLCAALQNNARSIFVHRKSRVLYLGASSGTTVSHLSDIATEGVIYAVEFSPRSIRELVQNCTDRPNVVPILADANHPYEYSKYISGDVDVVYQDVAQPNQTDILMKNAKYYLRKGGEFIYCIKARSIDSTGNPNHIFKEQQKILEENDFHVSDDVNISKYQTDHRVFFGNINE